MTMTSPKPRLADLAAESSLSIAAVNHILRNPEKATAEVLARFIRAAHQIDFVLPEHVTACYPQRNQNGLRTA